MLQDVLISGLVFGFVFALVGLILLVFKTESWAGSNRLSQIEKNINHMDDRELRQKTRNGGIVVMTSGILLFIFSLVFFLLQ